MFATSAQQTVPAALSTRLRAQTAASHEHMEHSSFVNKLFKGECTEREYAHHLWALAHIYGSLERNLAQHRHSPFVAPIFLPEVFRHEAIRADLSHWDPREEHRNIVAVTVVARDYAIHLDKIARRHPAGLVGHAYVRYLGDLSGGQILGHSMRKKFPERMAGFAFYEYPSLKPAETKMRFRAGLDEIGAISPEAADQVCAEANLAFQMHRRLFEALGAEE